MSASLPEAFLWAASAGVYVGAIIVILWRLTPVHCKPNPVAAIGALLIFAATRVFPDAAMLAPLLFVSVVIAVITAFRSFRPGQNNDGLFVILYVEAIAPILIVVVADYFAATQAFRDVAAWMCAAPAPSALLYLIVTRNQSVP